MLIADVLIPVLLEKTFSYECNEECCVGQVVCVPLRGKKVIGLICAKRELAENLLTFKIRKISQYFDIIIPEQNLKFIDWVSDYNIIPKGMILRMAVPFEIEQFEKNANSKQGDEASKRKVSAKSKESSQPPPSCIETMLENSSKIQLNAAQDEAAKFLSKNTNFSVSVLDGVTGSGKTETYLSVIIERLKNSAKKQILILLPEIALTTMLLRRFECIFGFMPDSWHSLTTKPQKWKIWQKAVAGEPMVVVGTRSSIFIPFKNLSFVVLDEEHDPSYKQNERGSYNAHDMAIVLASIHDVPIVLASATPSIETVYNIKINRYQHVKLDNRFAGATMPKLEIVDLRKEPGSPIFSKDLSAAIARALKRDEQVLLFLNQRGYAPISVCKHCGYKWRCAMCDVNLIYHRKIGLFCCHHCGFEQKWTANCPECQKNSVLLWGIGTERVLEAISKEFSEARTLLLSSDTAGSKKAWNLAMERIQNNDVNIIIGTQILTKGHHFPNLTVVGVIDADQSMNGADLRTNERTFQLIHQVAGRAGREKKEGIVFVQTYSPDSPLMRALLGDDRDSFNECELADRQAFNMPPFCRLISIILSGRSEITVQKEARRLARGFPANEYMTLLGPAPAVLSKLRGRFRYRFLIKANKDFRVQHFVKNWARSADNGVNIQIDVDPQDFI
jgi:primosomal protein N' (replication factor Y)